MKVKEFYRMWLNCIFLVIEEKEDTLRVVTFFSAKGECRG